MRNVECGGFPLLDCEAITKQEGETRNLTRWMPQAAGLTSSTPRFYD